MEDMINYLKGDGEMAIYDGSNFTRNRRFWVETNVKK